MSTENSLPADWAQVLDDLQEQIDQVLAQVVEPSEPPETESPWQHASQEFSARLRLRIDQLDERAAQSHQQAQQFERRLAFEAEALQAWLTQVGEARKQLAQATSRAIS